MDLSQKSIFVFLSKRHRHSWWDELRNWIVIVLINTSLWFVLIIVLTVSFDWFKYLLKWRECQTVWSNYLIPQRSILIVNYGNAWNAQASPWGENMARTHLTYSFYIDVGLHFYGVRLFVSVCVRCYSIEDRIVCSFWPIAVFYTVIQLA